MNLGLGLNIATTKSGGGLLTPFDTATPTAGYSLRPLSIESYGKPVVEVRRSSDNAQRDFTSQELTNGTLESWIHSVNELPSDYGAGAAAAYSLRYVSANYTGSVVRVRRSSDNAEQDFTPSEITDGTLLAWVGTTVSDHGYVTTWYDQSGNSNDATNSTGSKQPKIVDAGVLVEENGKPAVEFDGVDDGLSYDASGFDIGNLSSFAVGNYDVLDSTMLFMISGSNNDKRFYAPFATSVDFRFGYADNSTATSTAGDTDQHLFTMIAGSTLGNMESYIDASSIGTATLDSGITPEGFIGEANGGFYADCKVQEIIISASDQSANRATIEANINKYYGIYTPTVDGFVSKWYDQFGSNDAVQATAAEQPKIWDASTGLVTEDGKPALDFDGVDDSLATPDYIVELSQNNATVLSVTKALDSRYILVEADVESPYSSNFILGDSDGGSILWVNVTEFGVQPPTTQALLGFTYDGTNFQAYLNGATSGSAGTATVNTEIFNQTVIGSRADQSDSFYTGLIQEIITYKSDQTANLTAMQNNINDYYDIY